MPDPDRLLFVLALESMPGVGRVTISRILDQFGSYAALRTYPREQILLRLKGTPRLDALVDRLLDEPGMTEALKQAQLKQADLARRNIRALVPGDDDWPAGFSDLPRSARPVRLSAFGQAGLLRSTLVGFFARPPITDPSFEAAQEILRHLMRTGTHAVAGIANGFDVVLHKIAASSRQPVASVLVCGCGLARVDRSHRPQVRQSVEKGGVLLSPFALHHGPFAHDDTERALVQAAISRVTLFFEPRRETPEWEALGWSLEAGRPVFGVPHPEHALPDRVHLLRTAVDVEWIEAAVQAAGA